MLALKPALVAAVSQQGVMLADCRRGALLVWARARNGHHDHSARRLLPQAWEPTLVVMRVQLRTLDH